jgi:hypothetical protein
VEGQHIATSGSAREATECSTIDIYAERWRPIVMKRTKGRLPLPTPYETESLRSVVVRWIWKTLPTELKAPFTFIRRLGRRASLLKIAFEHWITPQPTGSAGEMLLKRRTETATSNTPLCLYPWGTFWQESPGSTASTSPGAINCIVDTVEVRSSRLLLPKPLANAVYIVSVRATHLLRR